MVWVSVEVIGYMFVLKLQLQYIWIKQLLAEARGETVDCMDCPNSQLKDRCSNDSLEPEKADGLWYPINWPILFKAQQSATIRAGIVYKTSNQR